MFINSTLISQMISTFSAIIMFLNGLVFSVSGIVGFSAKADITYRFDNSIYYSAAGTITVTSSKDTTYEIYWGDSGGKKLSCELPGGGSADYSRLTAVTVSNGTGSSEIYSFTSIPVGAECVLAYKGNVEAGGMKLPAGKITKKDNSVYSFGGLSDVHFNRYSRSGGDDAMITFPKALNFLNNCGVSLVAMSGDISARSEDSAFEKFGAIASMYDFPVYTCTGNHDCVYNDTVNMSAWQANMNPGVYGEKKADGICDIAENGLDFVYAPKNTDGDVFVFFSQIYWWYGTAESRLVTDSQLDWLSGVLEKYKTKTVYLFFHTFLANCITLDAGTGEGNNLSPSGVYYSLNYTVGATDEVRFRGLMEKYKNVVFFNGHSHWKYSTSLKYNKIANITDYDGKYATMVHISSVTSPRDMIDNGTAAGDFALYSSEGMLIKVYKDHIQFIAVDFMQGQFLSYATYAIAR